MTTTAEALSTTDMILVAQEMEKAYQQYRDSAMRLSEMEEFPGQFANAISGQRQMAHWCAEVSRKAKALRGFEEAR